MRMRSSWGASVCKLSGAGSRLGMAHTRLYPPCAAASASIIKGLKSRKLAVLMVTGQCLLAWICAWIAYRLALV